MSNTNSIESSEIDITQNAYKLETDHEKLEKIPNNNKIITQNSDNLNKTDKVIVPIDDYNKDDDKKNPNNNKIITQNSDNLNKTDKVIVPINDYNKDDDKKIPNNNKIITKNIDNLNKTDEVIVPIDDYNKDGDKINTNGAKKDFLVYGYYVREPIWVNMESEDRGSGGGGIEYDPATRNPFIRLVFLIVFVMLLITAGFGTACLLFDELGSVFKGKTGFYIFLMAMVVMLGLSYGMACIRCCRVLPCNIVCLALTVMAMSVAVGYIVKKFNTSLVIFAVIATAAVVFVCCLLALTSFDFTKWILYVVVISVVLVVLFICVTVATLITGESYPVLRLIILVVATLINAVMLTIQIQMVLGGKSVELEENDYAYAAFMIYTSIVDLFIQLVQTFGLLDYLF